MTTETLVIGIGIVMLLFLLVLVTIVAVLFFQLRKIQSGKGDVSQILPQIATMNEKLSHIEPVTQAVNSLQVDMRGFGERIATVEKNQGMVNQGVGYLATNALSAITELKSLTTGLTGAVGTVDSNQSMVNQGVNHLANDIRGLGERIATVEKNQGMANQGVGDLATNALSAITELKSLTTGLSDATGAMRVELSRANNDLTELHTHIKTGQESERQVAESVRRLETIIAGTQTKGSAGENVLEVVFSKLPIEWQVRDFKIGGKSVEFALRLPNNLIMPIDSKWAATNLLEQFFNTENIQEQQRLKKEITDVVLLKAKEVRKYLDPAITVNFGIAVVPDAVFDLCTGIQSEVFQLSVVLVSYSMFVPYLLLVFQTSLKNSQSIDLQKLDAYLQTARESIKNLQDELDGRFSRGITMMNNSRDDMRAILGQLGGSLTGLQMGTGSIPSLTEPIENTLESQNPTPEP